MIWMYVLLQCFTLLLSVEAEVDATIMLLAAALLCTKTQKQ